MWPWLMIIAGVLVIAGALIARQRMMRDYRERLALEESEEPDAGSEPVEPESPRVVEAPEEPETPSAPAASRPRITITEPAPGSVPTVIVPAPRTPAPAPAATPAHVTPTQDPLFADLPTGHRLTTPPTIRVRAQDVPLQDWLRYYADGNAWSGVIQSISDRVTGDSELRPYLSGMDGSSLQRHVMSIVMMLTGEGVTVGAVRRLAAAHLEFVQAGGEPITEPVWDRIQATFANALREHSVPESAVRGLDVTAAPLKSVIVSRGPR